MTEPFEIRDWNRKAWDQNVARGNRWTVPVSTEVTQLISGMVNPLCWLFTEEAWSTGNLTVTQSLPWSDAENLDHPDVKRRMANGQPIEFGHPIQELIGGQLQAGFHLTGLYEDGANDPETPLSQFTPWMLATRSIRPSSR